MLSGCLSDDVSVSGEQGRPPPTMAAPLAPAGAGGRGAGDAKGAESESACGLVRLGQLTESRCGAPRPGLPSPPRRGPPEAGPTGGPTTRRGQYDRHDDSVDGGMAWPPQAQAARDIVRTLGRVQVPGPSCLAGCAAEFVVFAMPCARWPRALRLTRVRLAALAAADIPAVRRLHPAMTEAEVRRRLTEGQNLRGRLGLDRKLPTTSGWRWGRVRPHLAGDCSWAGRLLRGWSFVRSPFPASRHREVAVLVTNQRALQPRGLRRCLYLVLRRGTPDPRGRLGR